MHDLKKKVIAHKMCVDWLCNCWLKHLSFEEELSVILSKLHIYIYIYIYISVCMCSGVIVGRL
jgi:hypothetical protein